MEEQRSLLLTESAWAWLDTDDFNLGEADTHMVISHSLWDDLAGDEVVARSLFSSSSSLTDLTSGLEKSESPQSSRSWNDELPPRPLKRRRVLQSNGDESSSSGSIESSFSQAQEDSQAQDQSSFNWQMTNESINSANDAAELSTESWMVRYFSDSDTNEIQDVPHPWTNNHLAFNAAAPQPFVARTAASNSKHQIPKVPARPSTQSRKRSGQTLEVSASKSKHPRASPSLESATSINKPLEISGRQQMNVTSEAKQNPVHIKESSNPVLAYPFEMVKPSRIQGDVTLQDINQRVKMLTSTSDSSMKQSKTAMMPPASGKSVVGLTRIHTEGKGTITILRTRSC